MQSPTRNGGNASPRLLTVVTLSLFSLCLPVFAPPARAADADKTSPNPLLRKEGANSAYLLRKERADRSPRSKRRTSPSPDDGEDWGGVVMDPTGLPPRTGMELVPPRPSPDWLRTHERIGHLPPAGWRMVDEYAKAGYNVITVNALRK